MKDKVSHKKQFVVANRVELENRIVPSLAFVGILISFVGYFVNLLIHVDYQVMVVTGTPLFLTLLFIFFQKKKNIALFQNGFSSFLQYW